MEPHSRRPAKPDKPKKPYPDFPLFPHATGQWAKKIRGKLHYFGVWADPAAALKSYQDQRDDLHAGRVPRAAPDAGITVKELANTFLNAKQERVDSGELSPRTWRDYKEAATVVIDAFGWHRLVSDLHTDDFASLRSSMAKRWGVHRLGKTIQCVRSLFKHAYDASLIDRPMRFGPGFQRPSKRAVRVDRAGKTLKLFSSEEVRQMVDAARLPIKAMVLLGINCGYGNADCGRLMLRSLDLTTGWADHPRPKTGIPRRNPLWPETVDALRTVIDQRREPINAASAGLVFITQMGNSWAKDINENPITKELKKLILRLKLPPGRNFYCLRHTFRTVADEARDQPAADFLMGHESTHMSSHYRERISDERLKAVSDHVRKWLFGPG